MKPAIGRPTAGLDRRNPREIARMPCSHGDLVVYQNERFRWLDFGNGVVQSAMLLADPAGLVLAYTRAMAAFALFVPSPLRMWVLGLGGGSLPRFLRAHYPGAVLTAVDSDRAVIEAAHAHFRIPRASKRLAVVHADADAALAQCPHGSVDAVFVDLFGPTGMVEAAGSPAFHARVRERLRAGGALVLNIWVHDSEAFLELVGTLREVFEARVLCLPVDGYRNVILLAFDGSPGDLRLQALRARAQILERRMGLDFPGMVARLARNNLTGGGELLV